MYMETLPHTMTNQSYAIYWDQAKDMKGTSVLSNNTFDLRHQDWYLENMIKLEKIKQSANNRLYKKTNIRLSPKQMEPLNILLEYCHSCNPLISFFEDKIKVQLNMSNRYMIDFPVKDFDGRVLVGQYKNNIYTISEVLLKELKQILQ